MDGRVPVRDMKNWPLIGDIVYDEASGSVVFQGTEEEKAWLMGLDDGSRARYLADAAKEGRPIDLAGMEPGPRTPAWDFDDYMAEAAHARLMAGEDVISAAGWLKRDIAFDPETGDVIYQGTDEEKYWLVERVGEKERAVYLALAEAAGRSIDLDGIEPRPERERGMPVLRLPVRTPDSVYDIVRDDRTGKVVFQGTEEEKAWFLEQDAGTRVAYLDTAAMNSRTVDFGDPSEWPEVRKPEPVVHPSTLDIVYDEETGKVVFKGTDEEQAWLGTLEPADKASYLGIEPVPGPQAEEADEKPKEAGKAAATAAPAAAVPEAGETMDAGAAVPAGKEEPVAAENEIKEAAPLFSMELARAVAEENAGKAQELDPKVKPPVLDVNNELPLDDNWELIREGTPEEKAWIAGLEPAEQAAYVMMQARAGRYVDVSVAFDGPVPDTPAKARFVTDLSGDLASYFDEEDEIRKPILQGTDRETDWLDGLEDEQAYQYLVREKKSGRDVDVPVMGLDGELVRDPETKGFVIQGSDAERAWASNLSIEDREAYLKRERDAGRDVEGAFEIYGEADRPVPAPDGPGSVRDMMRPYSDTSRKMDILDGHDCVTFDGGKTYEYEGPLGKFAYDPKQFALTIVEIPADDNGKANEYVALQYVGTEKDGRKIKVPEGLKDASYMFAGNKALERAPSLPDSVTEARFAFMGCSNLKSASAALPANLEDGRFMFADCMRLERGPSHLPNSMKHADGMFADDVALRTPPTVGKNMKTMNYAFANCMEMQSEPKIPKGSRLSATGMTAGCDALGRDVQKKLDAQYDKARGKAERQATSRGFMAHVASMCSAVAQFCAEKKRGANMFQAAMRVHKGRQQGVLGKNFSDVFVATSKKQTSRNKWRAKSLAKDARRRAREREIMERWDRTHVRGSTFSDDFADMAASAAEDFKGGIRGNFFTRVQQMDDTRRLGLQSTKYGREGVYEAMMDRVRDEWGPDPTAEQKKGMVAFFMERLSENVAYYNTARGLMAENMKGDALKEQLDGLRTVSSMMNDPLVEHMKSLQEQYGLCSEAEKYRVNHLLHQMGYPEKTDIFADADRAVDDAVRSRTRPFGSRLVDMKDIADDRTRLPEPEAAERPAPAREDPQAGPAAGGTEEKPAPAREERQPEAAAAARPEAAAASPEAGKTPEEPEEKKDIKDKVVELGGAALEAGGKAARAAAGAAGALLGQIRVLAAAAAESRRARQADEPATVAEAEDQAAREMAAARSVGADGGKDLSDAKAQRVQDENLARNDAMRSAAEKATEDAVKRQRAAAAEKALGDTVDAVRSKELEPGGRDGLGS